MDELFNRFSLEAIKFNSFVLLAMIAAWLVVVCCAVSSIRARPFSARQKLFWVVFVVAVPLVGVLAYLPFSFNREDLPDILLGKGHSKHSKRSSSSPRQLPNVKR